MRRADKLWDYLEKLDIRPERLQLEWISSAEGSKFSEVMMELEEMRQNVTMEEIEHTRNVLAEERLAKEAKRAGQAENLEAAEV